MDFWKLVGQRAFLKTRHTLFIETGQRLMVAVILVAVSLGALFAIGSTDAAKDYLIELGIVGAAILCLFPLFYLWNFIQAPSEIYAEQRLRLAPKERLQAANAGLVRYLVELDQLRKQKISSDNELEDWKNRLENLRQQASVVIREKMSETLALQFLHPGSQLAMSYTGSYNERHNDLLHILGAHDRDLRRFIEENERAINASN